MKLKQFSKTYERSHRPMIRLNKKSGLFTFNGQCVEKIGIDPNKDLLRFFQDEDSPKDWFICLSSDSGFKVRVDKAGCKAAFMNNTALVRALIKTLNIPEDCNSFIIGAATELNGVKYWPLLLNKA
ncbi:hypothetical protein [Elizabethkingia meningoseptica]|uniref:hypothetical protein n=1 Tax=Elizabethkingia meningoseptica TaxID=238 RepID=UPI0023B0E23B|nr:hypothetical protein [Elizabethkingia meningoseptica]MDE5525671.1 hypothetical protein [Elizabethkingia meningoseptica]